MLTYPTRVLAIDPGIQKSGFVSADFDHLTKRLSPLGLDTGHVKTSDLLGSSWHWGHSQDQDRLLIIELPEVRAPGRAKGKPEDILQLARTVGKLEQMAAAHRFRVQVVRPAEWKGTIDPDMHNRRVMRSAAQLGIDTTAIQKLAVSYRHNVIDALGLMLFAAGYTGKAGVLIGHPESPND